MAQDKKTKAVKARLRRRLDENEELSEEDREAQELFDKTMLALDDNLNRKKKVLAAVRRITTDITAHE